MASQNVQGKKNWQYLKRSYELYIFLIPALVVVFLFNYLPMYGLQIAFKDFQPIQGIFGSEWVGFEHFIKFFKSYQFANIIKNTFMISFLNIAIGFPFPIFLAIMINQLKNRKFRGFTQTIAYMPHFISTVVMVGLLSLFLSPNYGIYGIAMKHLGMAPINIMGSIKGFKWLFSLSDVWQHMGWNSIIYLAALSSIDTQLYDAAKVDGASKFQVIRYLELPSIMPTIIILLILNTGSILGVGFEKVYLMQNSLNLPASEVLSTYVYKTGLVKNQYSYSAAIGFFNTLVNFTFLVLVNKISKKVSETSLF